MNNLKKVIDQKEEPFYKRDLKKLLNSLQIKKGDIILLHASLSSFGYIIGGAETIIDTILEIIGEKGTIIMPSQTVDLFAPELWEYPAVPHEWYKIIKESMPAYDPKRTPVSEGLGKVAAYFAFYPGVLRSSHPLYSFAAYGEKANEIIKIHDFSYGLGKNSPLGKLYELKTKVLMLGTDFRTNTCIHLAEYNLGRESIWEEAPILEGNIKKWVRFKNIDLDIYDDYLEIEEVFFRERLESVIKVPLKDGYENYAMAFDLVDCVDFATKYYKTKECTKKHKGYYRNVDFFE